MRNITKPSTAKCNLSTYVSFLLSEPKNASCTRLSNILNLSHDSINRFLQREDYSPQDLFAEVKSQISLQGGTLSIDDSVIDKPYSDPNKTELIGYFWSGKPKRSVKGLNLVTLYYTDVNQTCVPVNFRLVDKSTGKTKNDYFIEMLNEVRLWGLKPSWITGDSWYSSLDNCKFLKHQELNFMFAIKNNRLVSIEKGTYLQIQPLDIPADASLTVYLKGFGFVKVFKKIFKNEYRYYVLYQAQEDKLNPIRYEDFERIHNEHWNIEQFHRAIKQVCNVERFQVRNTQAIKNHIFCAISAFVKLEFMRVKNLISNWYEIQKNLFTDVIRIFIQNESFNPALT